MAETVPFTTICRTIDYQPYQEILEQVVPQPGLIFSIADNGFGSGGARAYIVKSVAAFNKHGFPKFFDAYRLHKVYTEPTKPGEFRRGRYTVTYDNETTGTALVDETYETFKFQRRNDEAYYKERIEHLVWGRIIEESPYDK